MDAPYYPDLPAMRQLVRDGYLSCRKHPNADLYIWNYTTRAQFGRVWNEHTINCRGLITDGEGYIKARPFPKFFNYGEPGTFVPDEPFEVLEKLDGCFRYDASLNLWGGGTAKIRDVVNNKLPVILIGMDSSGNIVPSYILDYFNNGTKDRWLAITVSCPVSVKSGGRGFNTLRVTPNHSLFVNGKYMIADLVQAGDTVTTFWPTLSDTSLHLVESSLLGDGCITIQSNAAKYQENHKIAHCDYVNYIGARLGTSATTPRSTKSGYGSDMSWVASKAYKSLVLLRNKWYPDGKKAVPADLTWIDDFSVAKWYMDDGSLAHSDKQDDRAVFATNSFNKQDVIRLGNRLREMYGVSVTIYNNKGWTIRVNRGRDNSIDRLWEAIAPHIVPIMRYKLPKRYIDIPFVPYPIGNEVIRPLDAKVTDIKELAPTTKKNFPAGRVGFDIHTTTDNYFVNGVLVHNSLGILYFDQGWPAIASRGSFDSPQAVHATKLLYEKYSDVALALLTNRDAREYTILFEIVYPENRIVVNYGDTDDLYHLAVVHTPTGEEVPTSAECCPFPTPKRYDGIYDFERIIEMRDKGGTGEGFVVRFQHSGKRLKIKFADYLRLHKILCGITPRRIWELVSARQSLDDIIDCTPDEFQAWVRATVADLEARYQGVWRICGAEFRDLGDRKANALYYRSHCKYPNILFMMLDGRSDAQIGAAIWNMLRPESTKAFKGAPVDAD